VHLDLSNAPIDVGKSELVLGWTSCAVVMVLAAAAAISSTTGVGIGRSWYDEQRIIAVATLASVAVIAFRSFLQSVGKAELLVVSSLAIGLASAVVAARPYVAALDWSIYCLIALLILSARTKRPSMIETTAALAGVARTGEHCCTPVTMRSGSVVRVGLLRWRQRGARVVASDARREHAQRRHPAHPINAKRPGCGLRAPAVRGLRSQFFTVGRLYRIRIPRRYG